jgi:maltooligosyltrehalose trehalohydrolase
MDVLSGPQLGCRILDRGGAEFLVWAPRAANVELRVVEPSEQRISMREARRGYFHAVVNGVAPGDLYCYRLDDRVERPDPASRLQPRGVHGPSAVTDLRFGWSDGDWKGLALEDYIFYEIHVGTFTPEGTFDGVGRRLDDLVELGVTAIELMPVGQFPGGRNWGYDGVYPFAAHASYGGPAGLQRLVDTCHRRGVAVALDVVYNHLGPEGNYLGDFGPYFTDRYRTPWGDAVNYDGAGSDDVRRYFIENALGWITDFHVDALRLDAVHAIVDNSATPFLEELSAAVHERAQTLGRRVQVIAESDRNDARLVRKRGRGGWGLDGVWNDDLHHAVHTLLTGERSGYYEDFGTVEDLGRAFTDRFAYSGQYSRFRRRRQGNFAGDIAPRRFVVFSQNHDQTGNRMLGERLSALGTLEDLKLAAGVVLLGPFLPLLFMGEEYGERAPFLYFTSHGDAALIEAVRRGRKQEFAAFEWRGEPADPQDEETFLRSKITWEAATSPEQRTLREFYREAIRLRRRTPAIAGKESETMEVSVQGGQKAVVLRRKSGTSEALAAFHFGERDEEIGLPTCSASWEKALDSAEPRWQGRGSAAPARIEASGEPAKVTASARSVFVYLRNEAS